MAKHFLFFWLNLLNTSRSLSSSLSSKKKKPCLCFPSFLLPLYLLIGAPCLGRKGWRGGGGGGGGKACCFLVIIGVFMVILRLIKVLGGRIGRLKDGKDRTGRTQRERRDASHVFPTPHGRKSRKQVNVRQEQGRGGIC